jgi:hypothetical protein
MDKKTNIEKIRTACIKVNPDIEYDVFAANPEMRSLPLGRESRPIRLADVLLIVGTNKEFETYMWAVEDGCLVLFQETDLDEVQHKIAWDLFDDNLENQSEETLSFIASLL